MSKKNSGVSFGGKGYYIALVLCAIAIGITGFLYYRNAQEPAVSLQDPTANTGTDKGNVQAVATQPDGTTPTQKPLPQKPAKTHAPVSGSTVAEYAMDVLAYNPTTRDWRVHDGMDIAAAAGTQVCAAADGEVYTVYEDEAMGMTVVIRHEGGYTTKYASLGETVNVKAGDRVTAGQAIGCVGNSALMESAVGDHVHFSVSCDGQAVDPKVFLN